MDDTKLSTVVVQGTDNDYYLRHNFYGKTILGIPFIDYRASLTAEKQSMNLTIYGHAAQDGSYFAPIKSYKSLDYYLSLIHIYRVYAETAENAPDAAIRGGVSECV